MVTSFECEIALILNFCQEAFTPKEQIAFRQNILKLLNEKKKAIT